MDGEEKKTKLQNYSEKTLMKEEHEGTSYAGLILNGAAQQKAQVDPATEGKDTKWTDKLILKLALHDNLVAMDRALDGYINRLKEELAVLEIKRDTLASDIEQLENELRLIEGKLIAIKEATDRIERGEELVLDESGLKLKEPTLEALIGEYEKKNDTHADRGDTALLLAILQKQGEKLEPERLELEKRIRAEKERLNEIEKEIGERKSEITDVEEFKERLERIASIPNEAEREEQLEKLFAETPYHVLNAVKDSEGVPAEVKEEIGNYLESRSQEIADELRADAFWDDVLSEDADPVPIEVPQKPFA